MLHVADIKENKEAYIKALKKRNFNAESDFEVILKWDEERRKTQTELDGTLSQINILSTEIAKLFQSGNQLKASQKREESKSLKSTVKKSQENLDKTILKLKEKLYTIPNIPQENVPAGISADNNEEVFRKGEIPELIKGALPHWELAKKYDIIDFELGNKVAGAGFPIYKGKGARLQRAMIAYFLDKNVNAGYTEYQVPLMVNGLSGFGTGQLPDKEGQMYFVTDDDLYLIPTSEVPVTNMFRDVMLDENDLPITCTAYTPCFRREAGSYGAHVRGLNRLHQFEKVEIVRIEHPANSNAALDGMVEHIKEILDELKLPYRILRLCGGDLGFTSSLTYDFEVFSTAQDRWLEISSVSNFQTFQSNRLKLRIKDKQGNKQLAHTLNGSSLALPRVLAGILENYQAEDHLRIPEVLVPYCGFDRID